MTVDLHLVTPSPGRDLASSSQLTLSPCSPPPALFCLCASPDLVCGGGAFSFLDLLERTSYFLEHIDPTIALRIAMAWAAPFPRQSVGRTPVNGGARRFSSRSTLFFFFVSDIRSFPYLSVITAPAPIRVIQRVTHYASSAFLPILRIATFLFLLRCSLFLPFLWIDPSSPGPYGAFFRVGSSMLQCPN